MVTVTGRGPHVFPIENGNIPASYVSLPEDISFHRNLPPFHVSQPKRIDRPFYLELVGDDGGE